MVHKRRPRIQSRRLLESNNGLKQASRFWNIKFDEKIKSYRFHQKFGEAYVYKLNKDKFVAFLVLYIDNILLMVDNVKLLTEIKN